MFFVLPFGLVVFEKKYVDTGVLFFLENNYFPLCLCCPAGGLDFEKSRFFYLYNFLNIAKLPNSLGFEPREYARTLSFEKICRMH